MEDTTSYAASMPRSPSHVLAPYGHDQMTENTNQRLFRAAAIAGRAEHLLAEEPWLSASEALDRAYTSCLAESWEAAVWISSGMDVAHAALEMVGPGSAVERLRRVLALCRGAANRMVDTAETRKLRVSASSAGTGCAEELELRRWSDQKLRRNELL